MRAVDRRGYSVQKLSAETDTALVVPSYCCRRLRSGGIAELDWLHRPRMSFSIRLHPVRVALLWHSMQKTFRNRPKQQEGRMPKAE